LSELDYDVQYRLLNAAEFGVPQMRKRVYIVGFDRRLKGIDPTSYAFPEGDPDNLADIGDFLESDKDGYSISEHLQKGYLYKLDDGRPKVIDKNTKGPAKTLVASYHKIQRLTGTFVKDGPTGLRLYTENECKALMGFPLDFKVPVSRTQMYRQFGNSVVVPVISAIARTMKPFIVKGER
jgi:DNA (cytosine-5)-methyltransferase 1